MKPDADGDADAVRSGGSEPSDWVDLHGDAMFRFAMLRVGDPSVAEDLVQEAFLGALKNRKEFRSDSSERTWLIGILRHKIVDSVRRNSRKKTVRSLADLDAPMPPREERLRAWPSDPAKVFEQQEFWSAFQNCVEKLPENLADAYLMREVGEGAVDDICEQLGITPNNLSVRLHRARVWLRECLDRNWFHP